MEHSQDNLPELIARYQIAIILPYLERAFLKQFFPNEQSKEEILRELSEIESLPENEQIRLSALKIMADMIIEYWLKSRKGKKIKEFEKIKKFLVDNPTLPKEILMVYGAIKDIGFSGNLVDAEKQWQEAALTFFDNNNGFCVIQRKYLENMTLYDFTGGQEKRDFQHSILNLISSDRLNVNVGEFAYKQLCEFLKK